MQVSLGINTGFAINRFPEPDDWVGIVADELGLDTVQFTADLLNPFLPADLVAREVDTVRGLCEKKGVRVQTTFTSQFTRVNHLMHPNLEVQRVWVEWFKKFFRVSRDLGAEGAGSHFGIMSVRDNADAAMREKRINQAVVAWRELSEYGAEIGLKYLLFEPMSIPREVAETIPATEDILRRSEKDFAIPMRACLDVDHGDLQSTDPRDTDPHAWIRAFGTVSPCIHIKQSLRDKGGHYPFTAKYNEQGKIVPEEILATMRESGIENCTLLLEISHRERWPSDYTVVADLKESVEFWRPAIEAANKKN
ncbi:MAG: sugar phosphate isomerase/epimerase [Candidatus Hydrogenedentes bacterium]|nr:sugar phosphate isomerase/epimerase [Candidatus Hydrogenedentota bacterium]